LPGKGGDMTRPEDYLEFEKHQTKFGEFERIRIKGHRIAIDYVIEAYQEGQTAEGIHTEIYPSLTLDEVNAAITYYLNNKEAVEAYIKRGIEIADAYYQEWLREEPSPVLKRLRELKAKQAANRPTDNG
jgi:uncharacterized protein (DUF433 family)